MCHESEYGYSCSGKKKQLFFKDKKDQLNVENV